MYLPIEYTYTNGSIDTHAFYFVVKDNNNIKPEYNAKSGFQGDTLEITPEYTPSTKDDMNNPESYELIPGEYKDDRGNVWSDVRIDSETGVVTAVVPTGENINIIGGENIFIPVKVNYTDKLTGEKKSETVKAQFIARPKYQNEVVHEYEKDIPFETKEELDPNLEAGKIQVVNQGTVGKKKFKFTQAIQNGVKGIINAEGKFEAGDDKYVLAEETVTEKVDRLVKVGVKPIEETVIIPHTIEYIVDPSLKPGEEVVEQRGSDGEITITTSRDPKTGNIIVNRETKYEMQAMKIKIGAYDHKNKEPFETKIKFDNTKKAGETEVVIEGIVGETETKVTPAKIADMDDMYITIGEENFRDDNNNPNYDAIEKYMVEKGYWEEGKVQKTTDQDGKITATYNGDNIDDLLGIDEKNDPVGKVLVKGRVETIEKTKKRDKVIKVGTMTEGKHSYTEEIPFGYTVEYDKNMAAGTYEIVTAGKAGSKTTEWTITNSKADENNPKITELKPVNAVIKVGTKPVENMCPVIPPKGDDSEDSGKDKPSTPDNPKPGTDTPDKPENPDKPNPNKPVNPDKENPGTDQPDSPKPEKPDSPKPGTDTPEKPINPSPEKPKVPEESTPNKVEEIGPKDSENKNPALVENKENSEVEKVEEAKAKNEDSKEVETKEEDSENSPKFKDLKTNAMQGNKIKSLADNPKTYDAGIGGYAAITGLASSLLAAFEMKRRKKY